MNAIPQKRAFTLVNPGFELNGETRLASWVRPDSTGADWAGSLMQHRAGYPFVGVSAMIEKLRTLVGCATSVFLLVLTISLVSFAHTGRQTSGASSSQAKPGADKAGGKSQNPTKPDENEVKLNTDLVQIDAIITDKQNKAVNGLKQEDFEIFEDNKPQQLSFFAAELRK